MGLFCDRGARTAALCLSYMGGASTFLAVNLLLKFFLSLVFECGSRCGGGSLGI